MHSSIKRLLPFVRGRPPLDQEHIEHILLVGSASSPHIAAALQSMQARFPAARLALVILHEKQDPLPGSDGFDQIIAYEGLWQARSLQRQVADLHCDLKVVLMTGEGQMLLKLLAFTLPARRMLVYSEGGGSFDWSFDHRQAIFNHLRWRVINWRPSLQLNLKTRLRLDRAVFKTILNPLLAFGAFIGLLLWHGGLLVKRIIYRWRLR
jgi:hypothetical protein